MEKLKNIPSLRFPEFIGSWEVCKLGEIMNFKVTNSFSRENLNYEKGVVKNIHYGDIHTKFQTLFDITNESVPFINEEISIGRISEDFYCKEGDIIFADASEDINDVGKSIEIKNLNGEKLLSGLHTLLARPIENKFMIGFNGYLFKSNNVRVQIQKESQGSKVLSINVGRISSVNLSFPSIQEQTKIASFLTTVDDKLQALKQKNALLEQYKKGVMQKIFSQELRFKDDNGNDYPDWEEKKLGDTLNITIDNRGKTPPTLDHGIPLLEVNSIGNKNIKYNAVSKFVSELTFETWFRKHLKEGDVLFSTVGNTALCSYYDGNIKACIAQNIVGLRFNTEVGLFMYYLLIEDKNNNKFKQIEMGAVQPSVKVSQMIDLYFEIPSTPEQTKIATFLSAIDDKINHCQVQIEKMEVWKKGLLQQMFV